MSDLDFKQEGSTEDKTQEFFHNVLFKYIIFIKSSSKSKNTLKLNCAICLRDFFFSFFVVVLTLKQLDYTIKPHESPLIKLECVFLNLAKGAGI